MSDPKKPLIHDDADDFERRLLGAARRELPPQGARERAATALGLGLGNVTPSPDGAPQIGGPGGTSGLLSGKWLALLGGAAVGGAMVAALWSPSPSPVHGSGEPLPVVVEPSPPAPSSTAPMPTPPPVASSVALDSLPDAPAVARSRSTSRTAPPPAIGTPSSDDTLARETALIDQARAAVSRSEGAVALAALDRHDREFPSAVFALDAAVLRIEALERTGRFGEARALAERFLVGHPEGSYARRVRAARDRMTRSDASPDEGGPEVKENAP